MADGEVQHWARGTKPSGQKNNSSFVRHQTLSSNYNPSAWFSTTSDGSAIFWYHDLVESLGVGSALKLMQQKLGISLMRIAAHVCRIKGPTARWIHVWLHLSSLIWPLLKRDGKCVRMNWDSVIKSKLSENGSCKRISSSPNCFNFGSWWHH